MGGVAAFQERKVKNLKIVLKIKELDVGYLSSLNFGHLSLNCDHVTDQFMSSEIFVENVVTCVRYAVTESDN